MEIELTVKTVWIARDMDGFTRFYNDEPKPFNEKDWGIAEVAISNDDSKYFCANKFCKPGEAVKYVDGEVAQRKYLPGAEPEEIIFLSPIKIDLIADFVPEIITVNGIEYRKT
jgi:hypothetical protein